MFTITTYAFHLYMMLEAQPIPKGQESDADSMSRKIQLHSFSFYHLS